MTTDQSNPLTLPTSALLYAYDVFSDGRAVALGPDGLGLKPVAGASFRWVHLDMSAGEIAPWLGSGIDPVVAASLTQEDTRPRCVRHEDGVLLFLRGVNLNPDADPEDMVSIRLWVTPHLVVSVRLRRLIAVTRLRERMERNEAPPSVSRFLDVLSNGLTSNMDPVIMGMADRFDDLEEASLEEAAGLRSEISDIRRKTIILKRYVAPQREALSALAAAGDAFIDESTRINLRESVDRVTRMVEELDSLRERCAVLSEQISDKRAEEMNDQLMVLSVVAAIFLPLGFVTGLLGVNVGGVPGASAPWAFAVLCLLLAGVGAALLWWFRRRRWL